VLIPKGCNNCAKTILCENKLNLCNNVQEVLWKWCKIVQKCATGSICASGAMCYAGAGAMCCAGAGANFKLCENKKVQKRNVHK
jgi:hypothetical protein